jgi:WD40 repeat protein
MRHPDAVGIVAFSADGRFALTVSREQVRLWDALTGEPLGAPLPHQREVLAASFAPDGKTILTRSRDRTVRIWQKDTARPDARRLEHRGWVTAVAFRPTARESFLTAVGAAEGKVLLWDADSGRHPEIILEGLGPIFSLATSPDGRLIAAGTRDHQVRLWNMKANRPADRDTLALEDRVLALAFSPDGRTLLTGTAKRRAEFWDVAHREKRGELLDHQQAVYSAAYSPDGRTVLTGSEDMTARLWDAQTHRPLGAPLVHQGTVFAVAFRPTDGRVVLTGSDDRTARLWDAVSGCPIGAPLQHPARVLAVAFSLDGRTIATGCGDGMARLWDAATGYPIGRPLVHRGPVRAVAFGSGSRNGNGWTLLTGSEDSTARLWEAPAPPTESPASIMHSIQAATGMILDAQDVAESLPPDSWRRLVEERSIPPGSAASHPDATLR